jgi:hypothetical protein
MNTCFGQWILIGLVIHFVRKTNPQNESCTPGLDSFCAPPKGAHTK